MPPECLVEPYKIGVSPHPEISSPRLKSAEEYLQMPLALNANDRELPPLKGQLLKWVGNKQKFAEEIIRYLPTTYGTYFEPFLGSGAVMARLAPKQAIASDVFKPLVEIWQQLHADTERVVDWYRARYDLIEEMGKKEAYEKVRADYNAKPNGADLLFLSRVCYGGIVRFRKKDGHMSTPCGPHSAMPPSSFAERAHVWAARTAGATFIHSDFEETMDAAKKGDICYLDPPYADSQTILYGAQAFSLPRLLEVVERCKSRGVKVALSIDGTKKSGKKNIELPIPSGLFEQEISVHLGRSMLRRFQMDGLTLESELVTDRLLLTY